MLTKYAFVIHTAIYDTAYACIITLTTCPVKCGPNINHLLGSSSYK